MIFCPENASYPWIVLYKIAIDIREARNERKSCRDFEILGFHKISKDLKSLTDFMRFHIIFGFLRTLLRILHLFDIFCEFLS